MGLPRSTYYDAPPVKTDDCLWRMHPEKPLITMRDSQPFRLPSPRQTARLVKVASGGCRHPEREHHCKRPS